MNYIKDAAISLADTLSRKNKDYAPTTEFSNFEEAAALAGLLPFDAMMIQIGIKYTRLKGLMKDGEPEFESMQDTLLDLAGYAIITNAWLTKEARDNAER